MASYGSSAPEPFPGSGDLPLATASGMDPQALAQAPLQARWAIAKAPTLTGATELLNGSAEAAAVLGTSSEWPPSGLDGDAQGYVNEFRRWLVDAHELTEFLTVNARAVAEDTANPATAGSIHTAVASNHRGWFRVSPSRRCGSG